MGKRPEDGSSAVTTLESLTAVLVVGVLALALGLVALVMPTHVSRSRSIDYTQVGVFDYSAHTPKGSPYGRDGLSAGEPILLEVVGPVRVGLDYRFTSAATGRLAGTAGLTAEVRTAQGLSRTFSLDAEHPFAGRVAAVSGTLPVVAIRRFIRRAQAGFTQPSVGTTKITLRPEITVRGTLGSHMLHTKFAPKLPFTFDGDTLTISPADTVTSTETSPGDALKARAKGRIGYATTVANTVPLVVVHPGVVPARWLGLGLGGMCLLLALWLARPLLRSTGKGDETVRIRTLYGAHLVEVSRLTHPEAATADVTSMEALATLAKRYESMIMHVVEGGRDSYLVWDDGMLYRYRPLTGAGCTLPGDAPVEVLRAEIPTIDRAGSRLTGAGRS